MKLIANDLRKIVLKMVYDKQSGHIGGSFSIAELVSYLYNNFELLSEDGDKLILSKGHAVPILYAALYELGILSDDDLEKFREIFNNVSAVSNLTCSKSKSLSLQNL